MSNRIIKFRFWDGKGILSALTLEDIVSECSYLPEKQIQDLIPLQFTGLFDKNKKEIYEGDIVRCYRLRGKATLGNENGGFNWYSCIEIGEIEWLDTFCGFVENYEHIRYDDIWPLQEGTSHRYEVIGNIFENEELLK